MLYATISIILKAYAQDEVNVAIETNGLDNTAITEGSDGSSGGSLDIGEQLDSIPSLPSNSTIADISSYSDSILFSILVVVIAVAAYYFLKYFVKKAADSLQLDKRELKGVNSITKMAIIVISVIVIIFHFSSLSGAAAGAISVAAGTIIGFSSRNTISNAIAGILLLSARPFKLGDRIRTTEDESLIGDVVEISLLYTKIKTIRNELVAIPNQTLLQRQIINYSGLDVLSITVNISMRYNNNRRLIEKLLIQSAKETEGIVTSESFLSELTANAKSSPDNAVTDPYVLLVRFGDYGSEYDLRAYTNRPREFLKIGSEIRKKIYDSFQHHGIDLTVPQAQIGLDDKNNTTLSDFR